jgi:two-component system, OmpR family, response regulator CpxR
LPSGFTNRHPLQEASDLVEGPANLEKTAMGYRLASREPGTHAMARFLDNILLIDDDVEMCEMLVQYLQGEGFKVEAVYDGGMGLKRASSGEHSLVVLDVMLPKMSGLDLLRQLRAESSVPVLLLTARDEEIDRIVGLEVGGDDYVPKPFSPRELLARIRAILRRPATDVRNSRNILRPSPIIMGDIEMDFGTRTVRCSGRPVILTAVEFNLLELLIRSIGQVVTRDHVAKIILGRKLSSPDRSIDVHISKLRQKLGSLPDGTERIRSVRSVGYIYTDTNVDDPSQ